MYVLELSWEMSGEKGFIFGAAFLLLWALGTYASADGVPRKRFLMTFYCYIGVKINMLRLHIKTFSLT